MSGVNVRRMSNQQLVNPQFKTPGELVTWMGAVQAQDYRGGLWALGLRLPGTTECDIEAALADKSVVRVGFMRGTLHLLPGADARWMIRLMGPRIRQIISTGNRTNKVGLEDWMFLKANDLLAKALHSREPMTRVEVNAILDGVGLSRDNLAYGLLLARAQADGLVCYAMNRGKQRTFTLLEEWLSAAPLLDRDAALAEFARRYFVSHGPATLQDYVWWSGLTVADARAGLECVKSELAREVIDGQEYWFSATSPAAQDATGTAQLLPNFDEITVGYRDRSAVFDPAFADKLGYPGGIVFHYAIMLDGRIVGTFKRTFKKDSIIIAPTLFEPLNAAQHEAVAVAVQRYGEFVGLRVALQS